MASEFWRNPLRELISCRGLMVVPAGRRPVAPAVLAHVRIVMPGMVSMVVVVIVVVAVAVAVVVYRHFVYLHFDDAAAVAAERDQERVAVEHAQHLL